MMILTFSMIINNTFPAISWWLLGYNTNTSTRIANTAIIIVSLIFLLEQSHIRYLSENVVSNIDVGSLISLNHFPGEVDPRDGEY